MKNQVVSGTDGERVIEKRCIYDNDEVYRSHDCLNLKHAHGIYEIELDRLDTQKKVYQWLVHLLEKNWVNRNMLARMVCILEWHFGYNLHEFKDAA